MDLFEYGEFSESEQILDVFERDQFNVIVFDPLLYFIACQSFKILYTACVEAAKAVFTHHSAGSSVFTEEFLMMCYDMHVKGSPMTAVLMD